jgi:hypothetical protein
LFYGWRCDKNNINGKEVLFDQLKISGLKYLIYVEIKKYGININNDNYNELDLWKANITFGDKLKNLTEEQIFKNSEQLVPSPILSNIFRIRMWLTKVSSLYKCPSLVSVSQRFISRTKIAFL